MRIRAGICAVALFASPQIVSLGASQYTLLPLPGLPGSLQSTAGAISSTGVVGASVWWDGNLYSGFPTLWQGPQALALPVPTGYQGTGTGINGAGDVIGVIHAPGSDDPQPVVWHGGQLQMLDTLGMQSGVPYAVNTSGIAAGCVYGPQSGQSQAVLWNGGQALPLGTFAVARSVNDSGQVLVEGEYAGRQGTWIWFNGAVTEVPSLGGSMNAQAINGLGRVVGGSTIPGGTADGYGFYSDGSATNLLPTLGGDTFTLARALNDSDQIVGSGYNDLDGIHALLWQGGQVFDLNTLIPAGSGWNLDEALAISDDGVIVGNGRFDGQVTGFELTPVAGNPAPEPSSAAALLLAVPLVLRRRR